ncbi:Glucosamine-6-phosphate isomerase (Glucosamine-6-phosphate deaminase) (GNPDA) (GlcN6P deaminase) [Lecanora helva]
MYFLLCYVLLLYSVSALWPEPRDYELGSSVLWLSSDVKISFAPPVQSQTLRWLWKPIQNFIPLFEDEYGASQSDGHTLSEDLLSAAFERMKHNTLKRSYVPQKFHPRRAVFEPPANGSQTFIREISIEESVQEDLGEAAYILKISEAGTALINTASSSGGLHAFETFSQLFFAHSAPTVGAYTPFAPVSIRDSPAFNHRGLNLDISRNWIAPGDVMRTIEAMAANKLNRLHIHASDAQSWPLEIPALPDLAIMGAYSPSQIWRTEDLEAVQRHGKSYGVEVFIEIDLPGHTTSIGNAYPQLITAKDEPWAKYSVEPPSGQLRLNSSDVPSFLDTLLHDLLSRTSQHSRFFHLGGDELNLDAYSIDPSVNSSSREVLQPLVQSLIDQVISIAKSYGLIVIMWEEMILDWDLNLPNDIIVQTWRGSQNNPLAAILGKGHQVLFGSNAYWYLDCGHGTFLDLEPSNPVSPIAPPYLDYCSPYKNWRHMHAYNPLDGIPEDQQQLVIGGEAHLWGELTDSVNLDDMLWPRVAAAAEVMWSGSGKKPDEGTTRRLADMRERLVIRGIRAGVVQMEWCLRHEGGCTL